MKFKKSKWPTEMLDHDIQLRTLNQDYEDCHGMEILIYKYNSTNKLEWMKVIPRSTFKELTGVSYFVRKNLNILYYEDPQNLVDFPDTELYGPQRYKKIKSAKKSMLVFASIDEKGTATREKIETNGKILIMDKANYDKVVINEKKRAHNSGKYSLF